MDEIYAQELNIRTMCSESQQMDTLLTVGGLKQTCIGGPEIHQLCRDDDYFRAMRYCAFGDEPGRMALIGTRTIFCAIHRMHFIADIVEEQYHEPDQFYHLIFREPWFESAEKKTYYVSKSMEIGSRVLNFLSLPPTNSEH